MIDFIMEADSVFDFEREPGSLLIHALAEEGPRRIRAGRFSEQGTLHHGTPARVSHLFGQTIGGDTTLLVRHRLGRVIREVRRNGRRWLRLRAEGRDSIVAVRFLDTEFERTRADFTLVAPVTESYLYDPTTGEIDSLTQTATYGVTVVYHNAAGPETTCRGMWEVRRSAVDAHGVRAQAEAEQLFFLQHGRWSPSDSLTVPRSIDPVSGRMPRSDSLLLDSLLSLRAITPGMAERLALEQSISASSAKDRDPSLYQRILVRRYVPGDHFVAAELLRQASMATPVLEPGLAIALAGIFPGYAGQRRAALDRQAAFAALLDLVGRAGRVDTGAATILGGAAERTDDPHVRDLFLLAAYRGKPREYLPVILARTDTAYDYGPIVRRYAAGDPTDLNQSWGTSPEDEALFPPKPMPSLYDPWQAHEAHATAVSGYWTPQRLREWLDAHAPDGHAIIARRFATESDPLGRLRWAQYLFELDDHTPVAWMRSLVNAPDSALREQAYRVMDGYTWGRLFQDTLPDGPELAELQDLLLRYAHDEVALERVDGATAGRFNVHDERPDQHLLLDENLASAVRASAHWRDRFELLTSDALAARAEREGIVMAIQVGPITRVGERYGARVSLSPWTRGGAPCLCGGGAVFTFVRREGRWLVLSDLEWIS